MTAGPDKPIEVSSPACLMHEVGESYMGYLDQEALIIFMNVLLGAERDIARVALASANEAKTEQIAGLMQAVQRDESRWCAMLAQRIKALGGVPSEEEGAFFEKAMGTADLSERVLFVKRSLSSVVRALAETLPRVRDDHLRSELAEMRFAHEAIIAHANDVASGLPGSPQ